MNRIALDLGTHTGWAALLDGGIVSGVWDLTPRRFQGGGMRYVSFMAHFTGLLNDLGHLGTPRVYFEEVRRHKGTDASHIYGGFMAHLTAYCDTNHIPYEGIPVGTIKKHATGRGNANKEAMMHAARTKWPDEDIVDDNDADARWLLDYVITCEQHGVDQ